MMRRRLRKIMGWGTVLVVAVIVGGGWFAFTYVTDSDTLRAAIQAGSPKFLPGCRVDVQKVQIHPFAGRVVLHYPTISQVEGGRRQFVGISPWVQLSFDPWAMLDGRFDLREVVVAQPKLRVRRRADGSWNLVGLLADPWPMPPSETTPPIRVENGTVELVDESDGPDAVPAVVLRDVSVRIAASSLAGTPIRFEGSARGDLYDEIKLAGTIDRATGRVAIAGDLARLAISKTLRDRIPREYRPIFDRAGLAGGQADIVLRGLVLDPKATPRLRYDVGARLRSGVWKCDKLPFPITDLAADLAVRDGIATIESASGHDGSSTVHASGTIALSDPATAPFSMAFDVDDLEIARVRDWAIRTLPTVRTIAADFRPNGRIDVDARLSRSVTGGPIAWDAAVGCRDVSFEYREFKYPLDHVSGIIKCSPARVTVDLRTLVVGGRPLAARGTIDKPGPNSRIDLDFTAEALPVDAALLRAMPPDVRKVVDSFKPVGNVRGKANLRRTPPAKPGDDPRGTIAINADLDLNPGCEITWDGLKYPVRDLTGHLEIHPESWIFRDVRGTHGQATITGEGRVDRKGPDQYKVGIHINADNILFEDQLRQALQPNWRDAWNTLNPEGAADVDVTIHADPTRPADDTYDLVIRPRPKTKLGLKIERIAAAGDPGGPRMIEMPMEDVTGLFVFHNGVVSMTGGEFTFHSSPVKFDRGEVRLFESGKFALGVTGLRVSEFRLDGRLRKLMPPVMAGFAVRLDDGKAFNIHTDLSIAWSGRADDPATCGWKNGTVTLMDNSIAGISLKHLQGQIDHLEGGYDGRALTVRGALDMGSINLFDLQITQLQSPIEVVGGVARLADIRGTLMKGTLTGSVEVGLESTPKFAAKLAIEGADLHSYAKSIPGKQSFGGRVSARLNLSGMGQDLHTLQGDGEAHVTQGDLGKLPTVLKFVSALNLAPNTKTLFDQADVIFTIRNGQTTFDPIRFLGYAVSLQGKGGMDAQGELDINLAAVYSRDAWHIPGVSDLIRRAEGQILTIRVRGTASAPIVRPEFLPAGTEALKALGDRTAKDSRRARDRR